MIKNKPILFISSLLLMLTACEQGFEKDLRNKKVNLRAPVNNLVTTDTLHTFYWDEMDGALKYQLQVVSPRIDSIVRLITDTILVTNKFKIDLIPGDYQWQVKAINDGSSSAFSDIWNLRIQ